MSEHRDRFIIDISNANDLDTIFQLSKAVMLSANKGDILPIERLTLIELLKDKAKDDIQSHLINVENKEATRAEDYNKIVNKCQTYIDVNLLKTKDQSDLKSSILSSAHERGHRSVNFRV